MSVDTALCVSMKDILIVVNVVRLKRKRASWVVANPLLRLTRC